MVDNYDGGRRIYIYSVFILNSVVHFLFECIFLVLLHQIFVLRWKIYTIFVSDMHNRRIIPNSEVNVVLKCFLKKMIVHYYLVLC